MSSFLRSCFWRLASKSPVTISSGAADTIKDSSSTAGINLHNEQLRGTISMTILLSLPADARSCSLPAYPGLLAFYPWNPGMTPRAMLYYPIGLRLFDFVAMSAIHQSVRSFMR
jgi:hypothetical protein